MKVTRGDTITGEYGQAIRIHTELEEGDPPDKAATLASYFLHCPGQSPAWDKYILAIIHLRDIPGVKPAVIRELGMTHEVLMYACDPDKNPNPDDMESWHYLTPINLMEQIVLPDDASAVDLLEKCAQAVVFGVLWAEPPLSHQVEPWRTMLQATAEHYRTGGHHE